MEGQVIVFFVSDEILDVVVFEVLIGFSYFGVIFVVVQDLDKVVVMCEGMNGKSECMVVMDWLVVEVMVLKDWILCKFSGWVVCYVIIF